MNEKVKLTAFSKGAGCGCKLAPNLLHKLKSKLNNSNNFPQLLVGNESNDDAAAFAIENGNVIISTTDFFTPIVNDPPPSTESFDPSRFKLNTLLTSILLSSSLVFFELLGLKVKG